jgi:phage tail sheath protein FI
MGYQLSPGVVWSEIDLTTIIPAVSTTIGAYAGDFEWGPINEIVTVSDELELVDRFYRPTANTYKSFYTVANFLAYAQSARVVRTANTGTSNNATNGFSPLLIENNDHYVNTYGNLEAANTNGMVAAKWAGDLGNSLRVSYWCSANATAFLGWEFSDEFNGAPGTSSYAADRGGANDEMHIVVQDRTGRITGIANTILEKFSYVSKASDAKNDDGSSNYYVRVLADESKYIWPLNHAQNVSTQVAETTTWGNTAYQTTFAQNQDAYTFALGNGAVSLSSDAAIELGYDLFNDEDQVDVSLLMAGAHSQTVAEYLVDNIAESRKDLVVFISPLEADAVNNAGSEAVDIIDYRNDFNSSSYAFMDCNWKYQFDKYNNVYRWLPLNGDIAGLAARTDFERDPWWSFAGYNRGHIKNVTKLAWNPKKAARDDLYKNGINPVISEKGEGALLKGDKTMLTKPSAFDRINVRRLFIVLEKAISQAAKYSLFEFNDEFTRAQFVAMVEPYLRDVKGRRGIYDFRVVCDETNNTPEVIDRNEFIGDIYIKPARSINFIQLNFIAVRTGVAFSEVVGKW